MTDTLDKFSELDPARALRQIVARLAALESGGTTSDSITTGASPVAADPDTSVTSITMTQSPDGEGIEQVITLALPSSPETKIGRTKRFVMSSKSATSGDIVAFDATNILNTDGYVFENVTQLNDEILREHSILEFILSYSPNVDPVRFAWYPHMTISGGAKKHYFSDVITLEGDDFAIQCGGTLTINVEDDLHLPEAIDVSNLATEEPEASGKLWNDSGVLKIS